MIERQLSYTIGGAEVPFLCVGDTAYGEEETLLSQDDDLTGSTEWAARGYTVQSFLTPVENARLRSAISEWLQSTVERVTGRPVVNFEAASYHQHVDDAQHREVVTTMIKVGLPEDRFPDGVEAIERRMSEVCEKPLRVKPQFEEPWGRRVCSLRLTRPNRADSNPPHRDVWSPGGRNLVNLYFGAFGSNEHSSLGLVPGSHWWSEADIERTIPGSTKVDGVVFSVGSVVSSKYGVNMIRPDPGTDDFLVFSPYLIHGGARNFNPDVTRISLEMRFERVR